MTTVWNEMSYRRFINRKNEIQDKDDINYDTYCYSLYEYITIKNTFSVDDLYYYDSEE